MNDFDLIVFDCDGVLVDSERITAEVFSTVLQEECELFLEFEFLLETFMGQSSQRCLEIIEEMLGHKPPIDLQAKYQNSISIILEESIVAISGIEKALTDIAVPCCVASGGSYEKMRMTLGKTNLFSFFEGNIFSSSDVANGKPHPDVFLYAAEKMNCISPSRCLVIEDSPLGVKGGVAAGMKVFGFANLIKKQRLIESGAHHIFTEMANLENEITSYEKKLKASL